jgi:hypothetical protein
MAWRKSDWLIVLGGGRAGYMGKRPAEDELFEGDMGSIQREIRSSMQREEKPAMETGLERIAAKARSEPKLRQFRAWTSPGCLRGDRRLRTASARSL